MPTGDPVVHRLGIFEKGKEVGAGVGKVVEGEGEIDFLLGEEVEEGLDKGLIGKGGEADFSGEDFEVGGLEKIGEAGDLLAGEFEGLVGVGVEERDEGFGEAGEVPLGDCGLVLVGVALAGIDEGKGFGGVEFIEKSAGSVVDRFAGKGHVIGIHHAVDEAEAHPLRDELGLGRDDVFEEGERTGFPGLVSLVGVGDEGLKAFEVVASREKLGGSDAEVRAGDAGEDGTRFGFFADD